MTVDLYPALETLAKAKRMFFSGDDKMLWEYPKRVELDIGYENTLYIVGYLDDAVRNTRYFGRMAKPTFLVDIKPNGEFDTIDNFALVGFDALGNERDTLARIADRLDNYVVISLGWNVLLLPKTGRPINFFEEQEQRLRRFIAYVRQVYWSKRAEMFVPAEYADLFVDLTPTPLVVLYSHGGGTKVRYVSEGKGATAYGPGKAYHKASTVAELLMQLNSSVLKKPIRYRIPEKYYAYYAQLALDALGG